MARPVQSHAAMKSFVILTLCLAVDLRSDGWSADARVASIRHGVHDRMRVTLHDGRVL